MMINDGSSCNCGKTQLLKGWKTGKLNTHHGTGLNDTCCLHSALTTGQTNIL